MAAYCFVPGCDSRYYRSKKTKKPPEGKFRSLFLAPKESLEAWRKAIPSTDKVFSEKHKLCELHFTEDCIERTFETKLSDGTVFVLERGKKRLKPGSIPTLFPSVENNVLNKKRKRKALTDKTFKLEENEEPNVNVNEDTICDAEVKLEKDYEMLLLNVKNIYKPNSRWTITPVQEFIMCAKWSPKHSCERRVIVCQDLSVKIFLKNVQVPVDVEVCDAERLSLLLLFIDDITICKNAESRNTNGCLGYIAEGKTHTVCNACRNLEEQKPLK